MNNQAKVGAAGYYKFEAVKADGSRRLLADWFPNLITNQGLDHMAANGFIGICMVGSGSTAPAFTDTGLQTFVGATTGASDVPDAGGVTSVAPYYGWYRHTYRFAMGVAAGNLSEVGVGWATGANLFSRALIRDAEGNPTTITVLSDEFLDVSYELRLYSPTGDVAFTADIGGITRNIVMRPCLVASNEWAVGGMVSYGIAFNVIYMQPYYGPLGPVTGKPSGATVAAVSRGFDGSAYVPGSHEWRVTFNFGLAQGNVDPGISAFTIGTTIGAFQCSIDPPLLKDNTKVMSISVVLSWGRYTP